MDSEATRGLVMVATFGEGVVSRRSDVESWVISEDT